MICFSLVMLLHISAQPFCYILAVDLHWRSLIKKRKGHYYIFIARFETPAFYHKTFSTTPITIYKLVVSLFIVFLKTFYSTPLVSLSSFLNMCFTVITFVSWWSTFYYLFQNCVKWQDLTSQVSSETDPVAFLPRVVGLLYLQVILFIIKCFFILDLYTSIIKSSICFVT